MLDTDLRNTANINLADVFGTLAGSMTGADFGEVRFDASGILELVERAAPVDLAGVLSAAGVVGETLLAKVGAGLPGGQVPGEVERLKGLLGGLGPLLPDVDLGLDPGLDSLLARTGAVRSVIEHGPLDALFGLVPGLQLPQTLGTVSGAVGGLVELARVLAGLIATAAVTDRLVLRADLLAGRLDPIAARAAATRLGELAADTGLVAALRGADPDDATGAERLGLRVVGFLDAVLDVERRWATGMGVGEAALLGLDLAGSAAGLELARLALTKADLSAVGQLATDLRAMADPLLRAPLPDPPGAAGDVIDQALGLVGGLTVSIRGWDPASTLGPVQRVSALALEPLEEVRRAIEAIAGTVASAIRAVRQVVDEVDLLSVAQAVQRALQPVVDTLDAIESAVGTAQGVLEAVCGGIETGLGTVTEAVQAAADKVSNALGRVKAALDALHLAELAETLRSELGSVGAALASAQLSPYFDTAIGIIDTGAGVIDAVPFGLLPTDVQEEIVDVARPIKQLDLQPVEDALRAELEEIRASLLADTLQAIEDAYAAVVTFLASLDPEPGLVTLEQGALAELRAAVAGVDPQALLAPATAALESLRGLLDGVDLRAAVLEPLSELYTPVVEALAGLDPAAALQPVRETLDQTRQAVLAALHLDDITAAVTAFRDRAAEHLQRLDPAALVAVLDAEVAGRIDDLVAAQPGGPPGGALGSLLVTVGQASGLDATEPAVGDALAWTSGREDGALVVRGRLQYVAGRVDGVRSSVAGLDPAPLTAAAQAQHRALTAALARHPPGSALRLALDPLLAGTVPAEVLGPLAENRRRYLRALEADAVVAATLAASGRSEVSAAAAGLHAALLPLAAIPARLRALLAALGIEDTDAPLPQLVGQLYAVAGPARVLPALTELLTIGRDKLLTTLDVLLQPALATVETVRGVIEALDVQPIVDELTALHSQVLTEVRALGPDQLLGDVLTTADNVVARLRDFDPLAPVTQAVAAAQAAILAVFEAARPTVVFADVVSLHHDILALAEGLDVAALLRPVLDALDGLAAQLDDGFDRTGDALQRLQAALPAQVAGSSLSGGVDVGVRTG